MEKIFITGSADGLGFLAARKLVAEGHQVYVHARNPGRAADTLAKLPGAAGVLTADLADMTQTKQLAGELNRLGVFDAIIHNAGVYRASGAEIFAVNVMAPYLLTALVTMAGRLVYLSSGMHRGGRPLLDAAEVGQITYSDSKLLINMLANAVARLYPSTRANAVDPGWVPTKMGGRGAPDDLDKGYETQVWLATSDAPEALVSGRYFYHRREQVPHRDAGDEGLQQRLLQVCAGISGIGLAES